MQSSLTHLYRAHCPETASVTRETRKAGRHPHRTGTAGCRGIQFYSTGGNDQYDLHVHDNIIRNTICDAVNFATANPKVGVVEAYNNVIYHAGTGPDPSRQMSGYSCIYLGSVGGSTAPAEIYNNSLYDCGARGVNAGALNLTIPAHLRNNIVYSLNSVSEPYFVNRGCSLVAGSNNDWYGAGTSPCTSQLTGSVNVDPKYVSIAPGSQDLHLRAGSPLIDKGVTIPSLSQDHDGLQRPQGSAYEIGAYEFPAGVAAFSNPPIAGVGGHK